MTNPGAFDLMRDDFGRLVLTTQDGVCHVGVLPVRAFPITAPDEGLSLVGVEGHEVAWVPRMSGLPDGVRALIEAELAAREFVPEIQRIVEVSGFVCPSIWQVQTDRGNAELRLKGEEDIRRLGRTRLLITSSHGVNFLVRDLTALDRHSRKLLDRFL